MEEGKSGDVCGRDWCVNFYAAILHEYCGSSQIDLNYVISPPVSAGGREGSGDVCGAEGITTRSSLPPPHTSLLTHFHHTSLPILLSLHHTHHCSLSTTHITIPSTCMYNMHVISFNHIICSNCNCF